MKTKSILWTTLYFLAPILPCYFFLQSAIQNGASFIYLLSGITGILSYTFFVNQFIMMARPKWLEKHFGRGKLLRFHMIMAVIALILAVLHKVLKETLFEESLVTAIGGVSLGVFALVSVISALWMVNKVFFKIKLVDKLRDFVKKNVKIKYQVLKYLHNLTAAAVVALLMHILLCRSVVGNMPLLIVMVLYFIVPFVMYLYRKILA